MGAGAGAGEKKPEPVKNGPAPHHCIAVKLRNYQPCNTKNIQGAVIPVEKLGGCVNLRIQN